MKSSGTKH